MHTPTWNLEVVAWTRHLPIRITIRIGQVWRDIRPTGKDFAQGGEEVRGKPAFDDKALRSGRHGGTHVVCVLVHRQKNHLAWEACCRQSPGGCDAIQPRHCDVEYDQVGLECGRFL